MQNFEDSIVIDILVLTRSNTHAYLEKVRITYVQLMHEFHRSQLTGKVQAESNKTKS